MRRAERSVRNNKRGHNAQNAVQPRAGLLGAVKTSKGDWLAYHYYEGDVAGAAKLQFSPILWTADGWPDLGPWPQ